MLAETLYNVAFAPTPEPPNSAMFELAKDHVGEALALYRELGDSARRRERQLGPRARRGRPPRLGRLARGFLEESLRAYREIDDPFGTGWALHELAVVDADAGALEDAELRAREALAIFARAGDLSAAVLLLLDLAFIARLGGDTDRAWRLAGAADAIRRQSGADLVGIAPWLDWEVPVRPTGDADALPLWDAGAALGPEAAIAYALGEPAH